MTAALYVLRSGMSLAWVERTSPGGQTLLTEAIENYPGFPKGVKGYELADIFSAHLEDWSFDKYFDHCKKIDISEGAHVVHVGDGAIQGATVIIATGSEYRRLGLDKEEEFTGKGVSYCALCDGNFFRDQTVAVVGGGNSALEEALYLAKLVKKLYLIHRREDFRGCKLYQDKCFMDPAIQTIRSTVVTEILGDTALTGVRLRDINTNEERDLELDGLFVFVGFQPLGDYIPDAIEKDEKGFVVTDQEMRTNTLGIFAAGDIRSKLCRQVATAVGDGATAANAAFLYLESRDA